jgi:hypothetical protein
VYDVRVLLDGSPLASQTGETPLEVDPGPHVFRCERSGASVDVQATLAEGERGRAVVCDLPGVVSAPPPPSVIAPAPPVASATPADVQSGGVPWGSWVLGSVAVLAAGSAAVFGGLELSQQSADARPGGCKPNCGNGEIASIQTKIDIAYVSAGVAAVALGAAVVLWLLQPPRGSGGSSQSFPQVPPPSW